MKYEAIEKWLELFKKYWVDKNLAGISSLFAPDVQYWETPYKCLEGRDAVIDEWRIIGEQEAIRIETSLWSMDASRSAIRWELEYTQASSKHKWSGVYLIELSAEGHCTFFLQVGEEQK